jgi:predicted O-methyltransferase YrrM
MAKQSGSLRNTLRPFKPILKPIYNFYWLYIRREPIPEDDDSSQTVIGQPEVKPFSSPDLDILEAALGRGRIGGMHGHALFLLNLARETKAKLVVEIGFGDGDSSCAFLLGLREHGGKLISIDIEDKPAAQEKIEKLGFIENWQFIKSASENATGQLAGEPPIDILLIDGYHSYSQVKLEYELYRPLMKDGGYILFHDSINLKGVKKFIDFLERRNMRGINFAFSNGLYVLQI